MLSRTASSLYWLGRYVERADFAARLVEATVRLDVLSARPAGDAAWASALAVSDTEAAFAATGQEISQRNVARFLTLDVNHAGSIVHHLEMARSNAKAVRTALTREAWTAINRAWLIFNRRASAADATQTLALVEAIEAETRGFEGAIHRMMRNQASWFIRLGQAIERADNTARLVDVKYHLLLPADQEVGGPIDRDQWTTILQTVSAVTAYRWLYSEGLTVGNVVDLLLTRAELPRSIAASAEEVVDLLGLIGKRTGLQGEADRMARMRHAADAEDDVARGHSERAAPAPASVHRGKCAAALRYRPAVPVRVRGRRPGGTCDCRSIIARPIGSASRRRGWCSGCG